MKIITLIQVYIKFDNLNKYKFYIKLNNLKRSDLNENKFN